MKSGKIDTSDIMAVALVGGRGERLGPLTWYRSKPAVAAGNTILSSFSTSNGANSGITKFLMVTQSRPRSFRRFYSSVYTGLCAPGSMFDITDTLQTSGGKDLYEGTADAFGQALRLNDANRKYVLGLSGDQIYRMDFKELFESFSGIEPVPDFLIVSQKVPREEAYRFGILKTEGTKVVGFEEKPKKPDAENEFCDASMGIYFAGIHVWRAMLEADRKKIAFEKGKDAKDPEIQTQHDIGGDVIPHLLRHGYNVHTFTFDGYWRDVGTPSALHEAYMDIFIRRNPDIIGNQKLGDKDWRIAAQHEPQFYTLDGHAFFACGKVKLCNSKLSNSVCSSGVDLYKSEIVDSILLGGYEKITAIKDSVLSRVIVDKEATIEGAELTAPEGELILVAKGTTMPKGTKLNLNSSAIVAPLEEIASNIDNVIEFRQKLKASHAFHLYSPEGIEVTLEELLARR